MTKSHAFNLTGAARKPLIEAIEGFANVKGVYQGAPKFGYAFYGIGVLDKEGTLHFDCDLQVIMDCVTWLEQCGFACDTTPSDQSETEIPVFPEQPHEDWENCAEDFREIDGFPPKRKGIMDIIVDELNANETDGGHWERLHSAPQMECGDGRWRNLDGTYTSAAQAETGNTPDTVTIEVPFTSCGDLTRAKENLAALLQSKATLIKAALGEDGTGELPIEFTGDTVKFEWLRFGTDSEIVRAWSAFLCAAVKFAKKAKRVTAKDGVVENEKFHFRAFMVRLGMNDAENKTHRKLLLRNLTGDAAFATAESKTRWQAKHLKRNEEVETDAE